MICALDIETIPNPAAVAMMPEPKAKKSLKDPAKITADISEKKEALLEKAALNPLTARIVCCSFGNEDVENVEIIDEPTDEKERDLIQIIFRLICLDDVRLVTFNGIEFDLPVIYKRAMILGVDPGSFGAPPLSVWTKRHSTAKHYDLRQIWTDWDSSEFPSLDLLAGMILGEKKIEFDKSLIAMLLATQDGRDKVSGYCLQDTRLTWRLWNRFNGVLFQ